MALTEPIFMQVSIIVPHPNEDEDEVTHRYTVNFSDKPTKEWYTKTLVWAMCNDRIVECERVRDLTGRHIFNPAARENV